MSSNGFRQRYTSRVQRDREGVRIDADVRERVALAIRPRGQRRGGAQVARRRAVELVSTSDESTTSRHANPLRVTRPHRQNILEIDQEVGLESMATLRSRSSRAWYTQRGGTGPAGDSQWSYQNATTQRPNYRRFQPNHFRNEGVLARINHGNIRRTRGHDVRYRVNATGFRVHVPRDRRRRNQRDRPLRRPNPREERKARPRRPRRPFTLST